MSETTQIQTKVLDHLLLFKDGSTIDLTEVAAKAINEALDNPLKEYQLRS